MQHTGHCLYKYRIDIDVTKKCDDMINHLGTQKNWQTQISEAITDIDEILGLLKLEHLADNFYKPTNFPIKIPRSFVAKMQVGNAQDPLFLQVVPDKKALTKITGYTADPLQEAEYNPQKGVLHKYKSRVLLTVTGACAVHCRYCFRQHFDYASNIPNSSQIMEVVDYIQKQPEVNEVLFSGGDPLSLSNRRILQWLTSLDEITHIKTVRFHTRLPVLIPERIDDGLLEVVAEFADRFNLVMVIHCNHANEVDANTARYLQRLKQSGVTLLNQAVLLAGVNDTVDAQVVLSEHLFAVGVLPYYLFLLDKVDGAAYYDVEESRAVALYWQMLERLPGYLMPKLAREIANKPYKTPINLYL